MSVHIQRLAASRMSAQAPELVLIHGWGMSSAVWSSWLPLLREHANLHLVDLPGYGASAADPGLNFDDLLDVLLPQLPEKAVYLGYSLGGMVAMQLAIKKPRRVQALMTLATNARFVADEHWPWAMPEQTFQQFADMLVNPALALKRFAGLQALGCADDKALARSIRDQQEEVSTEVLMQSLDWLASADLRSSLDAFTMPCRFCFAEQDALVPAIVSEQFPAQQVCMIEGAAHALFLSHSEQCASAVADFLSELHLTPQLSSWEDLSLDVAKSPRRKKQDVALAFSRAAPTYDSVAELQRQVGEALLQRVAALKPSSSLPVLDLGSGTGYFYPELKRLCSASDVIGLDLAEGMVRYARQREAAGLWLCGDAENLPLPEESVSLIFSSLAMQWCEDVNALFAEAYRVLVPGGKIVFSTLGPNTLRELRRAWQSVDDYTHVNQFPSWEQLRPAMQAAGFNTPLFPEHEQITLEYNQLKELTNELKELGAHNVNAGRRRGLMGKTQLRQFKEAYEQQRNERGYLPASYEVWYCVLSKHEAK